MDEARVRGRSLSGRLESGMPAASGGAGEDGMFPLSLSVGVAGVEEMEL